MAWEIFQTYNDAQFAIKTFNGFIKIKILIDECDNSSTILKIKSKY